VHSLLKFDSKEKFIWFCYLVVFITEHFTYFANGYPFHLSPVFCCCKITFTAMGKISREDRWRRYELRLTSGEKLEFTPLYERICEP